MRCHERGCGYEYGTSDGQGFGFGRDQRKAARHAPGRERRNSGLHERRCPQEIRL